MKDTKEKREYTGGSVSYYRVDIGNPTSGGPAYTAECNDIIEALGMSYSEGNAFKAIWRSCAAKKLGLMKEGYDNGLYDAEKVQFFGGRMVVLAKHGHDGVAQLCTKLKASEPKQRGWPYLPDATDPLEAQAAHARSQI